jgi:hypothetical protein
MKNLTLLKISLAIALGSTGRISMKAAQFIESGGQVVIEAEHYTSKVDDGTNHPWVLVPDDAPLDAGGTNAVFVNARDGRFLQVQPDDGNNKGNDVSLVGTPPYLDYAVKITTVGEYQLYLRVLGWDPDGSADSVYAEVLSNGERLAAPNPGWYRYGGLLPGGLPMDFSLLRNNPLDPTPVGWTGYAAPEHVDGTDNDIPAVFTIDTPGTYTIRISQREDGTSLDALILQLSSMDPPLTPGPDESAVEGLLILKHPVNTRFTPGETAAFSVKVSESGTAAYQWEKAAPNSSTFSPIAGATSATFTTGTLQASDLGTSYRVVVTSGTTVLTSRVGRLIPRAGQFTEADGQVVMEAENYTTRVEDGANHPWVIVPDQAPFATPGSEPVYLNARADKFVQVQPDDGNNKGNDVSLVGTAPYLDYAVKITNTGEYQLYLRVMGWDDGSADSVYAEILSNGQRVPAPNPGWYRYGGLLPGGLPMDFSLLRNNPLDGTPVGWTGFAAPEHVDGTDADIPAVFTIDSPGIYTIRISQREDGTSLDSLILQLSSMDPPTSPGPSESAFEATVVAPSVALESAGVITGPFLIVNAAVIDTSAKTLTIGRPTDTRFFRLSAGTALRIQKIQVASDKLVLTYQ